MRLAFVPLAAAALMGGCAEYPPISYSYYPSAGSVLVTVARSVDCSQDRTRLVVVTTAPTVTVRYAADTSVAPWTFEAARLRNDLANTDLAFSFYEDGRLKGVNASSTGQGEAILKNVVSLVGAALPLVGGSAPAGPAAPTLPECEVVANWGKGKPVSLTYAGTHELRALAGGTPLNLEPTADSKPLSDQLNAQNRLDLLQLRLTLGADRAPRAQMSPNGRSVGDHANLRLQRVRSGEMQVLSSGTPIWTGNLLVPGAEDYDVPIPRSAAFGKTVFAAEIAESGALTKIQYGRETGAGGPIAVTTAAATAAAPRTAAEQAADLKAQADVIAQAERLARCQANPDKCQ